MVYIVTWDLSLLPACNVYWCRQAQSIIWNSSVSGVWKQQSHRQWAVGYPTNRSVNHHLILYVYPTIDRVGYRPIDTDSVRQNVQGQKKSSAITCRNEALLFPLFIQLSDQYKPKSPDFMGEIVILHSFKSTISKVGATLTRFTGDLQCYNYLY